MKRLAGFPTVTERKEALDAFADALVRIKNEDAEYLHNAPHTLTISRPDEVKAAKEPVLRWKPSADGRTGRATGKAGGDLAQPTA